MAHARITSIPFDPGQRNAGILHPVLRSFGFAIPEWLEGNDNIGAGGAQLRHCPGQAARISRWRPVRAGRWRPYLDLGGAKADHRRFPDRRSGAAGQLRSRFEDPPRCATRCRSSPCRRSGDIWRDHGETPPPEAHVPESRPLVEFVVPQRSRRHIPARHRAIAGLQAGVAARAVRIMSESGVPCQKVTIVETKQRIAPPAARCRRTRLAVRQSEAAVSGRRT